MNGIATITIKGQPVELRFGLPANRFFFEALGKYPDILVADTLNEMGVATLLYCGYRNACIVKEMPEPYPLTRGDFLIYGDDAIVDPEKNKELRAAVTAYEESIYTKHYSKDTLNKVMEEVEDLKKKVSIGTNLKATVTGNSTSRGKSSKRVLSGNSTSATKGISGNRKKKKGK